jgi:hypothetical protein
MDVTSDADLRWEMRATRFPSERQLLARKADVHHERKKILDASFRDLCTHNHNVRFGNVVEKVRHSAASEAAALVVT